MTCLFLSTVLLKSDAWLVSSKMILFLTVLSSILLNVSSISSARVSARGDSAAMLQSMAGHFSDHSPLSLEAHPASISSNLLEEGSSSSSPASRSSFVPSPNRTILERRVLALWGYIE